MNPEFKIHLISKEYPIKSNWYEWLCIKRLPDGTEIFGNVEADYSGELVAQESFRAEEN